MVKTTNFFFVFSPKSPVSYLQSVNDNFETGIKS